MGSLLSTCTVLALKAVKGRGVHAYVFASDQKRKCRVLIVTIDHRFGKVSKATLASKGVYMYDEVFIMAAMRQFARYLTDLGMLYLNRRVLSRRFQ